MTNPNLVNTSQVYMRSNVQIPVTGVTDILANPASSNMIIRGDVVTVCNTISSSLAVDVFLTRSTVTYAIAKGITIPAYSSLVVLDKDYPIFLQEGDKIQVAGENGLQAICSYTIISDTSITLPDRPTINAPEADAISFVSLTFNTASTPSVTIPSVSDDDIAILLTRDLNTSSEGIPSEVLQTGFTRITTLGVETSSTRQTRQGAQYKLLSSSDTGATLTGPTTSSATSNMVLYVFRPNGSYSSVSIGSLNEQITSGNPTLQTVNVSGVTTPVVSLGLITGLNTHTPSATNFEPLTDLGTDVGSPSRYYSTYKIQNSSPSNSTIDMNDAGSTNSLLSFYMRLVL